MVPRGGEYNREAAKGRIRESDTEPGAMGERPSAQIALRITETNSRRETSELEEARRERKPAFSKSEEKTEADLNLPTCIGKVAIGVGDRAKRGVKRKSRRSRGTANDVTCVADPGDILMVEEIEGFR